MTSSQRVDSSTGLVGPIAVLGGGVEGRATIDYLLAHGLTDITVLDRQPLAGLPAGVASRTGDGYDSDLGAFATVFRSPGIRPDAPALERARGAGARILSATGFLLEHAPCPVLGVTGTLGKGTTASLLAAMLERAGRTVHLAGNIGIGPLACLDQLAREHIVVLEVSSFQAMDLERSPTVGVALQTTSEHLDWHRDVDEYVAAKAQLVAHQTSVDTVIHAFDYPGSRRIAAASPARRLAFSLAGPVPEGLYLSGGRFVLRVEGRERLLDLDPEALLLPGRFNLENVAAAWLAAFAVGADEAAVLEAARDFRGLAHRLELCAEGDGVRYYNDSYATRPEATLGALSCFTGPLAVILGGSEKNADFTALASAVRAHRGIVAVALIGRTAERLAATLEAAGVDTVPTRICADLAEAMTFGRHALPAGGTLLLSPACASFGLFPNYKVRGETFRALATRLAAGQPVV